MKTALVLAAGAALLAAFALPGPAAAQRVCFECTQQTTPGGGDGGRSHEMAEPFDPFKEQRLRDQFENGDPSLPSYVAGLPACKTELGDLRRVRAKAISAVEQGVDVIAICTNRNLMDQQDGIPSIRGAINGNDVMRRALRNAGAYSANDVVAVVLDGRGAKLYVHRNKEAGGGGSAMAAH